MQNIGSNLIAVATAIIGLAILAVLVSKNANTANVITATANALASNITAAASPVTNRTWTPTSLAGVH